MVLLRKRQSSRLRIHEDKEQGFNYRPPFSPDTKWDISVFTAIPLHLLPEVRSSKISRYVITLHVTQFKHVTACQHVTQLYLVMIHLFLGDFSVGDVPLVIRNRPLDLHDPVAYFLHVVTQLLIFLK